MNAAAPNLSLDIDPKTSWALVHRETFPIDVNKAARASLLRIPGVGVKNVERIIQLRRFHKITLADLQKMHIAISRAKYFVVTADHNPNIWMLDSESLSQRLKPPAQQLSLFDAPAASEL